MDFALRGINPRNKMGESLKYNVWSWRPLWHIIVNNSDILDENDRYLGQSSGQIEVTGDKHVAVINSLYRVLRNRSHGEVQRALCQSPFLIWNGKKSIVQEMSSGIQQQYNFTWNAAVDFLRFCKSNDGFALSE